MTVELGSAKEHHDKRNYAGLTSLVTIEMLLYLTVMVIAAVIRFLDLDLVPLSPDEAKEALAVWRFWHPDMMEITTGSPIWFSLSAIATQIFGFSDSTMRLVPVIFGIAIVPLPWFLRSKIGRVGSLLASGLLAISPIHVFAARTAGGQSAAMFSGMLLLVGWLRYRESKNDRWFYVLSVALALGLIAGPLFIGLTVSFMFAWLSQKFIGPQIFSEHEGTGAERFWPDRRVLFRAILLFLTVLVIGSTAVLLNLAGMGELFAIVVRWLQGFSLGGEFIEVFEPILALGRYELILLLFGITAAVWASWKGRPFLIFLTYWMIIGLLMSFGQPAEVANLLIVTIPGYLLIGAFVSNYTTSHIDRFQLAIVAGILLSAMVVWVNLGRYGRLTTMSQSISERYHLFLIILVVAIAGLVLILAFNWDKRRTRQGIIVGSLLLLLIYTWGTSWWLTRSAGNDTRERWITQATDEDILMLAGAVKEVSWQTKNSGRDLLLTSTVDDPSLEWYLRDVDKLAIVKTIVSNPLPDAVITPEVVSFNGSDNYVGTTYGYARPEISHVLDFGQALRWWLFRESPVPINESNLILWVRADLVGESG